MMSSERMGSLPPPPPPLSPDLCLATMKTVDMFDTSSWESSLGLESSLDRWTPLPSPPAGDSLAFWNAREGLEDIIGESLEAHLGLDHYGVDVTFLHDTASNTSHSSSSSTITSHSIPSSLGDVTEMSVDELGAWSDLGDAMASYSEPDVVVETERQEAVCGVSEKTKEDNKKKQNGRRERYIKHNCHKMQKLSTVESHVPSSCSIVTNPAPAKHQASSHSPHHCRVSSKENILSPRKKRILSILESNIKWSEMSGSEQWMLGEGLSVLLSQTLGVREKLDVLSLILPSTPSSTPTAFNDLNLASLLDDDKLEDIRRYLKNLENNNESSSKFHCRKAGKPRRQHMKHNTPAKPNKGKNPVRGNHRPSVTKGSNTGVPRTHGIHHSKRHSVSDFAVQMDKHKRGNKKHKQGPKKLPQTTQQATKVYRQLLKEKRSGLFKEEEVVCLSQSSAHPHEANNKLHRKNGMLDEEDEDVDIMG